MLEMFTDADPMRSNDYALPADGRHDVKNKSAHRAQEGKAMSFDIYGNPLQRGHCEVHPQVHEEYPCTLCLMKNGENSQKRGCDGNCESGHLLHQAHEHIVHLQSGIDNLHAENADLREKLAAMESQKPAAHAVYQGCLSGVHVAMLANAPKDFSGYLYAKPVPADKTKYKTVNVSDLPMECTREHLLSEAANRADYFFRQVDGSYSFPAPDGQVSQIIEMLLAAANMPKGKPSVAVPDGWKLVPVEPTSLMCQAVTENMIVDVFVKERMKSRGWSMEEILNHKRYMTMLAAAPSHSQQSAATDADRFCDAHCTWRDHHPDCPSHEIGQFDSPATDSEGGA